MLMQNFKSAKELDLGQDELDAHVKVLGMLERGELRHRNGSLDRAGDRFDMGVIAIKHCCGTVGCIGGWVAMTMGFNEEAADYYVDMTSGSQRRLYYPDGRLVGYESITVDQAARALRNYLTTGEPLWEEVLNGL